MTDYQKIAHILNINGKECYVVGGAVRDIFLGETPHDIDLATNATPDQIVGILRANNIAYTSVGAAYGTIVAYLNGDAYEITTYRKESVYEDGRHPDKVEFADTIEEDLSRRDFTMNAMAMDPFSGQIVDPFGGRKDLTNKVLRFVGNPAERVNEDSLRILRALRFSIKYDLTMTLETSAAVAIGNLDGVSKERKTEELRKILTCGKPVEKVMLTYPQIFFKIIPELKETYHCSQFNKYHHHDVYQHSVAVVDGCKTNDFTIKLAALLHDVGKPAVKSTGADGYEHFYGHPAASKAITETILAEDLCLSNEEKEKVLLMIEHHDQNMCQTEKSLRRAIFKYGEDFVRDLLILQEADRNDHVMPKDMSEEKKRNWWTPKEEIEEMFENIHNAKTAFSMKDLAISGEDLIEMGIPRGPAIGRLLKETLRMVVDGNLENTKENLIHFVEPMAKGILEEEEEMSNTNLSER